MKIRTKVKSGLLTANHNKKVRTLRIKSGVKSGALSFNHNLVTR